MINKIVNYLILPLIILLQFSGCKTGQYSPDFKLLTEQTERVVIFSPFVENYMNDFDQQKRDPALEKVNIALIARISKNSLGACYEAKDLPLSPQDLNEMALVYSIQDTSETFTKAILEKIFSKYKAALGNSTLAVFVNFKGEYPLPEDKMKEAEYIPEDVIRPSTRPFSDIQIFAFDIENREVLYYDRILTQKYSPEVYEDVVAMIQKLIKPLCSKKIK